MSGPGDAPPVIPVYLLYDAQAKRAGPLLQAKPGITFRWLKVRCPCVARHVWPCAGVWRC